SFPTGSVDWQDDSQRGNDMVSRVAALATERGGAIALAHENEQLDWAGLWTWSGQLAGRLQELGVGNESPVAVCLPRSLALVASLLAIWRAGGVYVPLDPALPGERLAWQVENCKARWLITNATVTWQPTGVTSIHPDEKSAARPDTHAPRAEQAAYIIYTS